MAESMHWESMGEQLYTIFQKVALTVILQLRNRDMIRKRQKLQQQRKSETNDFVWIELFDFRMYLKIAKCFKLETNCLF